MVKLYSRFSYRFIPLFKIITYHSISKGRSNQSKCQLQYHTVLFEPVIPTSMDRSDRLVSYGAKTSSAAAGLLGEHPMAACAAEALG